MRVEKIWTLGHDIHPTIAIPAETFAAEIGRLLPGVCMAAVNDAEEHAADVYLAAGCLLGLPPALAILEGEYFARVPRFIARIDRRPDFAQEVTQVLRERLLSPALRKLSDYSASGPLLAWMRISARRVAIDLRRREGIEEQRLDVEGSIWDLATSGTDPEGEVLRAQHREAVENAIRQAVASLSSRDRMVLRLYLLGGENIERIGQTYGVHRATVARWIVAAQDKILDAVRADLGARLGISDKECDSLARGLRSRLNVSLSGLL